MHFLLGLVNAVNAVSETQKVPTPTAPAAAAAAPVSSLDNAESQRIEVHVYLPSGRDGILRLTAKPDLSVGDLKRAAQQ